MSQIQADGVVPPNEATPLGLSESAEFSLAATAFYLGTALAYLFGGILLIHLFGGVSLLLAAAGFHLTAFSLLKRSLGATNKLALFVWGVLLTGFAAWWIFASMAPDNASKFLAAVVLASVAAALSGWRYRWLHP